MSRHRTPSPFGRHPHALSVIVTSIVVLWLVLYSLADPHTHLGAFYGNAIADWLGVLVFVVATKYFFEFGSGESRTPPRGGRHRLRGMFYRHSLTIVLALTGVGWALAFSRSDVDSKAGQVVGNILSDWTQVLGLVVLTKYAREQNSKEGN